MNSTIRKLPGSKRQFPNVKSVIDTRKPIGFKPDNVSVKPSKAAQDVARPSATQTRPPWDSSTRIAPTPDLYIKPLPGTKKQFQHLQRKSLPARPVPDSHEKPFRPVLPSKKVRQFIGKNKLAEKSPSKPVVKSATEATNEEPIGTTAAEMQKGTDDSGLISRMWNSVVGPILHPTKPDEEAAAKKTESDEFDQIVLPEGVNVPAGTVDPGLISRVFFFHSVIDPLLYSKTPEEEVAVKEPDSEEESTMKLHDDPLIMDNDLEPSAMSAESENAVIDGPTGDEKLLHEYPKGYGSKKERIRKALEKKRIMPGDELSPKKPFKNQTRKRAKSPSLYKIYENLMNMPAFKESE
jgi:hypothetical protein